MNLNERNRLMELTREAIRINEELLMNEKKFLEALSSDQDAYVLEIMNEKLNELCSKEHLHLLATKSLFEIMKNN